MRPLSLVSMALLFLGATACLNPADPPPDPGDPADPPDLVDPATPPPPAPPPPAGCADTVLGPEGSFLERVQATAASAPDCTAGLHAFAGARDSTLAIHLEGADAILEILDLHENVLLSFPVNAGQSISHTLDWSGEHLIRVRPTIAGPMDYTLTPTCTAGCGALYTRYPLFFMHGMGGTDSFLGGIEYWYQVADTLEPLGYGMQAGAVDPFQTTVVRAEQWADQMEALAATGQVRRFNLIAHSQAGLDARHLASALDPEARVQSITTIAAPHHGTAAADLVTGLASIPGVPLDLVDGVFDTLGLLMGASDDQDVIAQLEDLSTPVVQDFNAVTPDRSDVQYFSWAGRTCGLVEVNCQNANGGETVKLLLSPTRILVALAEGDNDGLVSVDSAMWGDFLGTLSADHLDEVGLLPGSTAPGFDHLQFYTEEAARLAAAGL